MLSDGNLHPSYFLHLLSSLSELPCQMPLESSEIELFPVPKSGLTWFYFFMDSVLSKNTGAESGVIGF